MPFFQANPEGGLAGWGPPPHLEAGNISGLVSTLVGERLKRQQQLQQAMEGIGQIMQQRKYDQIANAAADQLAGQAGITAPPMTGTTGEGTERLNAVKAIIAGIKAYPQYNLFHTYGMRPEELYPPSTTKTTPASPGYLGGLLGGLGAAPAKTEVTPGVKRGRYVTDPATKQAVWQDDPTGDQVNVGGTSCL